MRVPPPAVQRQQSVEQVVVEGVDGGEPADKEDEEERDHEQCPTDLLPGVLHEGLVVAEPGEGEEGEDNEEDEQHRVRQRGKGGEAFQDGRFPSVVAVRHGGYRRIGGRSDEWDNERGKEKSVALASEGGEADATFIVIIRGDVIDYIE